MKPYREIIAGVLILLFTYTALHKLSDHSSFTATLAGMPLLHFAAPVFSYAIPLSELSVAILLFFPRRRTAGLWASLFLLSLFTTYLAVAVAIAGKHLPCSCGGVISKLSWNQHLLFNIFFISLTLIGVTRRSRKPVQRVGNIPLHT